MKRPEFHYDENLREIPEDSVYTETFLVDLQRQREQASDRKIEVSLLGEMAFWSRLLLRLDNAENMLKQALNLIKQENLDPVLEVQQLIRLANVYQWQKRFDECSTLLLTVINYCEKELPKKPYLAFAWQHSKTSLIKRTILRPCRFLRRP